MGKMLEILRRLFAKPAQPVTPQPSPLSKRRCPKPMAGITTPEQPKYEAELPEVHAIRALKETLEQWHPPKPSSKNEISE